MRAHQVPGEEKEYNIKCKVQVIRQNYEEIADGRTHEARSVILLPDLETSEASRMMMTYLPEISSICMACNNEDLRFDHTRCPKCDSDQIAREHTEVPAWIGGPVHSPSRLAVLRKNNYCNQHHLFVMSTGVENDLAELVGRTVYVTILPTSEDDICDTAKSISRTVKD